MTDGNEYPLDSLRFLQEFDINPSLSDSVKLDTLIGEVREIKVMLSQLLALNSRNSSGFSFNPVSLGSGNNLVKEINIILLGSNYCLFI